MLEGLLVDLVPYGETFLAREHTWLNDEGVFFWSMGGRWFPTRRGIEQRQQQRQERHEQGDPRLPYGIRTKDGTPIGLFAFNRVQYHHRLWMLSAFIGDPDYWGGGYGTDALLLMAEYGFNWLDARKLWLMTMSLNARVVRQMEKVGFQLEARHRESTWVTDAWHDALTFGLLREEWPGRDALIEKLGLRARAADR